MMFAGRLLFSDDDDARRIHLYARILWIIGRHMEPAILDSTPHSPRYIDRACTSLALIEMRGQRNYHTDDYKLLEQRWIHTVATTDCGLSGYEQHRVLGRLGTGTS